LINHSDRKDDESIPKLILQYKPERQRDRVRKREYKRGIGACELKKEEEEIYEYVSQNYNFHSE
jgi:hypothetical protein